MDDPYDLERFVAAQDEPGLYSRVLGELRRGHKASHWMWFVFPQVAGLGHSGLSKRYALAGVHEAQAYLQHPILGSRLRECTQLVADAGTSSAVEIFGTVDAQKLHSSVTLFAIAMPDEDGFHAVLRRFFDNQPDERTVELLGD